MGRIFSEVKMKIRNITIMIMVILILLGAFFGSMLITHTTQAEEVVEYTDSSSVTSQTANQTTAVETQPADDNASTEAEKDFCDEMCICIIGNAKKSLTPDSAVVTAVIETLDADIKNAKDKNFQQFNNVLAALNDSGIDSQSIVIESYTSYPSYDYTSGKTLVGYYSITSFTFEVSDLDNLKKYIDVATENGVSSIRSLNYKVSNLEEEYSNVLMSALENAKEKAAKLLGRDDLKVCNIKEESVYYSNSLYRSFAEELSSSALVGKLEVQAKVLVEFQ